VTATVTSKPRRSTVDSHDFPTRPYDLVKEFTIALAVVTGLSLLLAGVFSSPDRPAVTLAAWAKAAPNDVVATGVAELAGTSGSAGYGPPYNHAADGQVIGPVPTQKLGGVPIPVDSAKDLVIAPLTLTEQSDPQLEAALAAWDTAPPSRRAGWAGAYGDALAAAPDGNPAAVAPGDYGPVPVLGQRFLDLARTGALQGLLDAQTFYGTDQTRTLLLLSDGSYLEDQARADHLGGDQWGMMNEVGNYPGQPWLALMTFWYQIQPFSSSENADALIWGLMGLITLVVMLIPVIPGLRSLPRRLGVYRLIWRESYRAAGR
jgi:hypothetical protein